MSAVKNEISKHTFNNTFKKREKKTKTYLSEQKKRYFIKA